MDQTLSHANGSPRQRTLVRKGFAFLLLLGGLFLAGRASASTMENLPLAYQPSDGSTLSWLVTTPDPRRYGPGPWPAILVVHAGGFSAGNPADTEAAGVDPDLAGHGYLVFSVAYRLAPPGLIPNQPPHFDGRHRSINDQSGRPPEQTDDIKLECLAARADHRCDGRLGIAGGSTGGSHGAFLACDTHAGPIVSNPSQFWSAAARPDVVACLSGAYKFDERALDPNLQPFVAAIQNYTNTMGRSGLRYQLSVSPFVLVTQDARPMILFTSQFDPQPIQQYYDLVAQLQLASVNNYAAYVVVGSAHAFDYWFTPVGLTSVDKLIFQFFDAAFAAIPPR